MSPRLFLHVIGLEAKKAMSYRVDFWLKALVGFVAEFAFYYFLTQALFLKAGSETIRGFDSAGLLAYYVSVLLIKQLVVGPAFFENVATDIYEGGLTRYLIYPQPYFGFKYAQNLGNLIPILFRAVLFVVFLKSFFPETLALSKEPWRIPALCLSLLVANLLYFSMRTILEMVAFWQDNTWSLWVMLGNVSRILGGAWVPLKLFPEWSQTFLSLLPFVHFYEVPGRLLVGTLDPWQWSQALGLGLVWVGVCFVLGRWVWQRGQKTYTGVGI